MIQTETIPAVAEVARHYDEIDLFYRELWGEHVHHGLWLDGGEDIEKAVLQLLDRLFVAAEIQPGERVCDIGCGYGGTVRYLHHQLQCEVVGYTVSEMQYSYALRNSIQEDGCRFVLGDWMECAIPDESFDVVLAVESTEHILNKAQLFQRIFRALVPGGRIAICAWIAAENPKPWQVSRLLEPICREGRLAGLGTETEYLNWLTRSGFESIESADLSSRVSRTWTLVIRRVLREAISTRGWNYLTNSTHRNREFLKTVFRLPLGYRTGALRYLLLTARKPPSAERSAP